VRAGTEDTLMPPKETPEQRKARETQKRAAEAQAAADSARQSGHAAEAATFEALAKWVEET
jgi:predicted esterase